MRRRIKRSSLFTMVAIVALLSLGIGYAAWNSTISVTGTVDTANANVEWTAISPSEFDTFGTGSCTSTPAGTLPQASVGFTIAGAYPGYSCTITMTATNNGEVPMKVQSHTLSNLTPGSGGIFTHTQHSGISVNLSSCGAFLAPTALAVGGSHTCTAIVSFAAGVPENTSDITGGISVVYALP